MGHLESQEVVRPAEVVQKPQPIYRGRAEALVKFAFRHQDDQRIKDLFPGADDEQVRANILGLKQVASASEVMHSGKELSILRRVDEIRPNIQQEEMEQARQEFTAKRAQLVESYTILKQQRDQATLSRLPEDMKIAFDQAQLIQDKMIHIIETTRVNIAPTVQRSVEKSKEAAKAQVIEIRTAKDHAQSEAVKQDDEARSRIKNDYDRTIQAIQTGDKSTQQDVTREQLFHLHEAFREGIFTRATLELVGINDQQAKRVLNLYGWEPGSQWEIRQEAKPSDPHYAQLRGMLTLLSSLHRERSTNTITRKDIYNLRLAMGNGGVLTQSVLASAGFDSQRMIYLLDSFGWNPKSEWEVRREASPLDIEYSTLRGLQTVVKAVHDTDKKYVLQNVQDIVKFGLDYLTGNYRYTAEVTEALASFGDKRTVVETLQRLSDRQLSTRSSAYPLVRALGVVKNMTDTVASEVSNHTIAEDDMRLQVQYALKNIDRLYELQKEDLFKGKSIDEVRSLLNNIYANGTNGRKTIFPQDDTFALMEALGVFAQKLSLSDEVNIQATETLKNDIQSLENNFAGKLHSLEFLPPIRRKEVIDLLRFARKNPELAKQVFTKLPPGMASMRNVLHSMRKLLKHENMFSIDVDKYPQMYQFLTSLRHVEEEIGNKKIQGSKTERRSKVYDLTRNEMQAKLDVSDLSDQFVDNALKNTHTTLGEFFREVWGTLKPAIVPTLAGSFVTEMAAAVTAIVLTYPGVGVVIPTIIVGGVVLTPAILTLVIPAAVVGAAAGTVAVVHNKLKRN